MAAIVSGEFQSTPNNVSSDLRAAIIASADWDPVPDWYENLSTFSGAEAVGQTVLSVTSATTYFAVGMDVVLSTGLPNEEVRTVTAVTSSTLTVSVAVSNSHAIGEPVGVVHSETIRCVTTAGTEMIVALGDKTPNAYRQPIAVYQSMTGTTAADIVMGDKQAGFLRWFSGSSGALTTMPLHVEFSAGPTFLWISVDGPRVGEPNAESTPSRGIFYIGTILPYDDLDTSEPLLVVLNPTDSIAMNDFAYVSRDAADTASWITAVLGTVSYAAEFASSSVGTSLNPVRDGTRFFWPWVVSEHDYGPRGRIKDIYFASIGAFSNQRQYDVEGRQLVLDGITYTVTPAYKTAHRTPFGYATAVAPVLMFVPTAGTP